MPHPPLLCRPPLSQATVNNAWSVATPTPTPEHSLLIRQQQLPCSLDLDSSPSHASWGTLSKPSSGLPLACKAGPLETAWARALHPWPASFSLLSLFLLYSTSRLRAMAILGTEGRGSFSCPKAKADGSPKVTPCHIIVM